MAIRALLRETPKPPSNSPKPKLKQPEAQPSRAKAFEPSTKRTRTPGSTPDDTLLVAQRPCPSPKRMGQGATGPQSLAQATSGNQSL
ncbi:hypothetical protein JTB14_027844 [Gonioctena quinquepunctata]|nr:hypothetical protein JTB14_027844 [Gonioctena quinquepunctata]